MVIVTTDNGERFDVFKLTEGEFAKLDVEKLNAFGEVSFNFVNEMEFSTAEEVEGMLETI